MATLLVYNSSGKIFKIIESPNVDFYTSVDEGAQGLLATADITKDFILQGEVHARPLQLTSLSKLTLTADGINTIVISKAPSGTFTATHTLTQETITGPIVGTDTFATTIPGTYKIKIESWPYMDFEIIIEAI
jgi:hypothetical protein